MRIIVTGASGLLGEEIADRFEEKGHEVIRLKGRGQLDLHEVEPVMSFVEKCNPDVIVHTAAIKDVDEAERHPQETYVTKTVATRNVALAAEKVGAKMVYISTDAVFDGEKGMYHEYDETGPINVYGFSKLAGEREVRELCKKHFIVRTGLLFGLKGKPDNNMVLKLMKRWQNGEVVEAGIDQRCSNTYTLDLAEAIVTMALTDYYGTYHVCNEGRASRYEFYTALCTGAGFSEEQVKGVKASTIKFARRHKNSSMTSLLFERTFGYALGNWEDAVERFMVEYNSKKEEL